MAAISVSRPQRPIGVPGGGGISAGGTREPSENGSNGVQTKPGQIAVTPIPSPAKR